MYKQKKIERILNIAKIGEKIPYKNKNLKVNTYSYNLLSSERNISLYLKSRLTGFMTVENLRSVFNYLRFYMKRYAIKNVYMGIRVLPLMFLTTKPAEMRMGKGRGDFKHRIYLIKKGQVLCELGGDLRKNKNFMFFLEKSLKKKLFSGIEVLYRFW